MTTLQSIITRNQKDRQASTPPSDLPKPQVRITNAKERAQWLSQLFPQETKEVLQLFAMQFHSEEEMQSHALQLKREGGNIKENVKEWNLVASRHQVLRNKQTIEDEKEQIPEPEKKENPTVPIPRETRPLPRGRGNIGKKIYEKPKPGPVRKWVKKVIPPGSTPSTIDTQAIESQANPVSAEPGKPTESGIEPVNSVQLETFKEEREDPSPPTDEGASFKHAEDQAHKMTLDLIDQSDASSDHFPFKDASSQTDNRTSNSCIETQTDEALIWRNGIPCMLVPLSTVQGFTVPVTLVGDPGRLFRGS